MKELRKITIHRALIRPILLAGGERELVIINMTLVCALIFGVGLSKLTILLSVFLLTVGRVVIVKLAKYDPSMSKVYKRHLHYQSFYPAKSSLRTPPARVKQSII